MKKSLMAAALILVMALTAAGCGANNAGTAAYRWNNAETQQDLARGAPETRDGTYHADKDGRVEGFREDQRGEHTENDLKKAGEDLMQGAKDAGESIGKAAGDTLDGLTGTPKNSSR